jgi:hypothetical protein
MIDAAANNASMVRLAILIVSSSTPDRCARLFDTIQREMTTAAMRRARRHRVPGGRVVHVLIIQFVIPVGCTLEWAWQPPVPLSVVERRWCCALRPVVVPVVVPVTTL